MIEYQRGEEYALKWLEQRGYTVIDRRQEPQYWKKDIDLTAIKDGIKQEIEVKWDSTINKSGALFLELLTDIERNKQGWASYTQADYIFYGDSKSKLFYVFSSEDMRKYLNDHKAEYETRTANDYNRDGSIRKQSRGAIVPLGLFCKSVGVQIIDISQRLEQGHF